MSEKNARAVRGKAVAEGLKVSLLGMAVNIVLAVVKGLAGVLGHSSALIADAAESITDVASSLVVFGGISLSSRPPDDEHPYGHGKAEPLAAMLVSCAVVAAGAGIFARGFWGLGHPRTEGPAVYTLFVLLGVVLVKEMLFRRVSSVGQEIESVAVSSDAWHHRSDAITSLAAAVGIAVALIGGPKYAVADNWAAMLSAVFIFVNGLILLRSAVAEIMDAVPSGSIEADVRRIAAQVGQVRGVETCRVRKMGFDYFVDMHVFVDGDMTVRTGHDIAHEVKARVLAGTPRVRDILIHVEPADCRIPHRR